MCTKCSVNYRLQVTCPPDRDQFLVSSEHIRSMDPDAAVVPVQYEDDNGNAQDPISIMLLSRN